MSQAFADLAGMLDHSIIIQRSLLANDRAAHLAERLRESTANAVVVYAQDDPAIQEAIAERRRAGVPVVTLISDLPHSARLAYAGIDHHAAGRTAGYYTARMARPGGVVVLCNHHSYRSHLERVAGFTEALGRHGPGLVVADILEGGDQPTLLERLLSSVFRRHPDMVAVYNAGAAHEAVEAVLRHAGRPVVFIGMS